MEQAAATYLPIGKVKPSKTNPRTVFEPAAMHELEASVKKHGVLQPILARPKGDGFEVVAGERRWRAAKAVGLKLLPAVVRELSDVAAQEIQLVENLQREDLTEIEEARGYDRLRKPPHELTVEQIAEKIGKSRRHVYHRLDLLKLGDAATNALLSRKLTYSNARLVALLPKPAQAKATSALLAEGKGEDLTYKRAQEVLEQLAPPSSVNTSAQPPARSSRAEAVAAAYPDALTAIRKAAGKADLEKTAGLLALVLLEVSDGAAMELAAALDLDVRRTPESARKALTAVLQKAEGPRAAALALHVAARLAGGSRPEEWPTSVTAAARLLGVDLAAIEKRARR